MISINVFETTISHIVYKYTLLLKDCKNLWLTDRVDEEVERRKVDDSDCLGSVFINNKQ